MSINVFKRKECRKALQEAIDENNRKRSLSDSRMLSEAELSAIDKADEDFRQGRIYNPWQFQSPTLMELYSKRYHQFIDTGATL